MGEEEEAEGGVFGVGERQYLEFLLESAGDLRFIRDGEVFCRNSLDLRN